MPAEWTVTIAIFIVSGFGCTTFLLCRIQGGIRKFNCLDKKARDKLLLLDYYMVIVNQLSKPELVALSAWPVKELERLNSIYDNAARLRVIKKCFAMNSERRNRGKRSCGVWSSEFSGEVS
jgi:hypothetical protein